MTQREPLPDWWGRSKEIVTFAGGMILILGTIIALIQWSSGGLQLQSQIDLREVRTQLNSIQTAQAEQAKAAKETQDRIIARLDALPRPSDYTNQENHLHALDGRVDALHDGAVQVRADVDNLMRPPQYRRPQ